MRKFSGINFINTNRLHLVQVIRIYFDKNLNLISTSSANLGEIKIKVTSQVSSVLNKFKIKYYI